MHPIAQFGRRERRDSQEGRHKRGDMPNLEESEKIHVLPKVFEGFSPIKSHENQIMSVEIANFRVAKRPRKCAANSLNPYLDLP